MAEPVSVPFPEPSGETADTATLLRTYLAYYRSELARRVRALDAAEQGRSRLPSGWTPLQLLNHLVHVERRWIVSGFLAEDVPDVWGDDGPDGRWVDPDRDAEALLVWQAEVAARVDDVLASTPLDRAVADPSRLGGRAPTLAWIGFHLVQEYARHLGQLDVVVELAGGPTGEPDEDG